MTDEMPAAKKGTRPAMSLPFSSSGFPLAALQVGREQESKQPYQSNKASAWLEVKVLNLNR
jgi:hypothetical protein